MLERMRSLCCLIRSLAISGAFSLICLAQQAAPTPVQAQQQVKEYPSNRIDALVLEWTRARDFTREYLDAMPADGYGFKPTPEVRSFAEQMLHLATSLYNGGARLSGQPNPYQGKRLDTIDELKTKAATTKAVMEGYDFLIRGIKGLPDTRLDDRAPAGGMNRPLSVILAVTFEHQTHHRGQTTIYLRLKGVTPPPQRPQDLPHF